MPGKIVSQEEWLSARKAFLVKEKELTRASDAVSKELREFPMVKLTKEYTFEGPDGKISLSDIFEGRKQLIVYHFMFNPSSAAGCSSCSFLADHIPNLCHLESRNTTFACISRAPFAKIEAFKKRMGWNFPWYSSYETDFNYDFHVSQNEEVTPVVYNYKSKEELEARGTGYHIKGEQPGMSVFFKGEAGEVLHSYSSYSRGNDKLLGTYLMLDMTPLGRQDGAPGDLGFPYHDKY